jgi:hypothetical protein
MGKMQRYKSAAMDAVKKNRQSVRTTVSVAEIVIGAGVGGYVSEMKPNIGGIPTDAGVGLVLLGVGYGMKQSDLSAIGVGMLAGYVHDQGRKLAVGKA